MDESYCPSGAANLGKGIGGILFSRFSRSSGQVGGVEEEPSDSDSGASEVENMAPREEGATMAESEEKDKEIEKESGEVEPAISQSTSAVMESTSCKYYAYGDKTLVNLVAAGYQRVKIYRTNKILFPVVSLDSFYITTFLHSPDSQDTWFSSNDHLHQNLTLFNVTCDITISV